MTAPESISPELANAQTTGPDSFGGKPRIYPMRLYGDPILRRKAKVVQPTDTLTVPGFDPQTLQEVANTMMETMFDQRGVGLAAPQIGLPVRMFVAVEYEDDEEENEGNEDKRPLRSRVLNQYVMLNPVIKALDKKKDKSYQEGCLSIPGIYEEGVPRMRRVSVTYTDLDGTQRTLEAEDYLARVFQHEVDHLDGVMFLDRLPAEVTDQHRRDLLKIQQASKNFLGNLAHYQKQQQQQGQQEGRSS